MPRTTQHRQRDDMLDINFIREHSGEVKESVRRRSAGVDVERILELDRKRRDLIPQIEELRAERNKLSDAQDKPRQELIEQGKKVKAKLRHLEPGLEKIEKELQSLLLEVPNLLHPSAPDGKDEGDNIELRAWGGKPEFDFKPKDHLELGETLDIIDIEKAAEISGSGFFFLKNKGALLELALVNFAINFLVEKGFTPIIVPELVRGRVAGGTGYIPQRDDPDIYKIENEDLWLSATAELPLTAYHMDDVLGKDDLPKNYVGFSSCFRREAGAYGKHKKGIYRVHQFDKVEIYKFTKGDLKYSDPAFHEIIALEEEIYQKLGIPYHVVNICTGDTSAPAYIKYDLEYWTPVDKTYREITSCSNCTDFQARRLNIRHKDEDNELKFVHTLNGSAVTSTRTIIAILENYQQADGSVKVPEALQKYMGADVIRLKRD